MFMVPIKLLLPTAAFMTLVLAASLQGLAASGHFPRGAKAGRSGPGPALLSWHDIDQTVVWFFSRILTVIAYVFAFRLPANQFIC